METPDPSPGTTNGRPHDGPRAAATQRAFLSRRTVWIAAAMVVVSVLAVYAFRQRDVHPTPVGRYHVPSPPRDRAGDLSEGWYGDVQAHTRGWLLTWRHQETHPLGESDASRAFFFLDRSARAAIPWCEGLDHIAYNTRPITQDHALASVTCIFRAPWEVPGRALTWHCGDGHRLLAFFAWDTDKARLATTMDAFGAEPPNCHGGTKPATSLPVVSLELPPGFRRTVEDPAFVRMVSDTDEEVRLGKGMASAHVGDLQPGELRTYPILPDLMPAEVLQRVLPASTFPHRAVQVVAFVSNSSFAAPGEPRRLMVATVWRCDRTRRVYGILWLGPRKSWTLVDEPGDAERAPHPAFMDTPRCVDGCDAGRDRH